MVVFITFCAKTSPLKWQAHQRAMRQATSRLAVFLHLHAVLPGLTATAMAARGSGVAAADVGSITPRPPSHMVLASRGKEQQQQEQQLLQNKQQNGGSMEPLATANGAPPVEEDVANGQGSYMAARSTRACVDAPCSSNNLAASVADGLSGSGSTSGSWPSWGPSPAALDGGGEEEGEEEETWGAARASAPCLVFEGEVPWQRGQGW